MAFRRKFHRGFRRRRRMPETYTLVQCVDCQNVYQDLPCSTPLVQAVELLTMRTPRNPLTDTAELSTGSDKFIVFDGCKFQSEFSHDPGETLSFPACDPPATNLVFNLRIWEAIVILPFAQGTQIPDYLPLFTNMLNQGGDLADRVLWKRISILPIFGFFGAQSIPQLETTIRDVGHGPVVVKSKAKLDDRHGLYWIRSYTHDVAGLGNPGTNDCTANVVTNPCVIPIQTDAWFKIFFHTRK